MTPPRSRIRLLVIGLLGAAALIGLLLLRPASTPHTPAAPASAAEDRSASVEAADNVGPTPASQPRPAAKPRGMDLPNAEDYVRSRFLFILATAQTGIAVSNEERDALAERYVHHQSVRGAYELSIATVSNVGVTLRVDIPAYPGVGAHIEKQLQHDFEQILGPERARALWTAAEDQLREAFAQFGSATQAVAAAAGRDSSGETEYRIRRSAEWVASDGLRRSNGSDTRLSASQIGETDYLLLAPLLGRLGRK